MFCKENVFTDIRKKNAASSQVTGNRAKAGNRDGVLPKLPVLFSSHLDPWLEMLIP